MATFGSGTNPDQLSPNSLLGGAAFINVDDLYSMLVAHTTLDLLRGSRNTTARVVCITDATVRGFFYRDDTDTTTADDGKDVLITSDDVPIRFKRREMIRKYTPTSSTDTNIAPGEICYDDTRFYVRTASNVVKYITFSGTL